MADRVPPLNLSEGERDELLDLVSLADDAGRSGEEFESLMKKTKALYRPCGGSSNASKNEP